MVVDRKGETGCHVQVDSESLEVAAHRLAKEREIGNC